MRFSILIFVLLTTLSFINAYADNILSIEIELNPPGTDAGNEWIKICNVSNQDISVNNWKVYSESQGIQLNGVLRYGDCTIATHNKQWLDNEDEHVNIYDDKGNLVWSSPALYDTKNDDFTLKFNIQYNNSSSPNNSSSNTNNTPKTDIIKTIKIDAFAELLYIVDGDTVEVRILNGKLVGVNTIRLADINAPEMSTDEGKKSKEFLASLLNSLKDKHLYIDIDDKYTYDKYNRIVAVVYYKDGNKLINLNKYLVEQGHAAIRDYDNEFDPSEFEVINDYNKFDMPMISNINTSTSKLSNITVTIDGKEYTIDASLTNGKITNIIAEPNVATLTLSTMMDSDGQLTITLPRTFLDSLTGGCSGNDDAFVILLDNQSEFAEENNTSDARKLTINVPMGTEEVAIVGTCMVPEFSTLVTIVLVVAVSAIIIMTRKNIIPLRY